MPLGIPDTTNLLTVDGQSISLDFERTGTTGKLRWALPSKFKAYDGILLTVSRTEINPSNYPTDGVIYTGSLNLQVPADMIGSAQVVAALYNDRTTTEVSIVGLEQNVPYYFSAHVVSNIYTYYSIGVRSYPTNFDLTPYAGDMNKSHGPPANPVEGDVYYDIDQRLVFYWDGITWLPTSAHTVLTGQWDPTDPFDGFPENYPEVGDFFYNTVQQSLKVWNGTLWRETESTKGVPTYLKQGVGTDVSYTARANLIDILRKQLGSPVICVELIEDHYNIAIDNALQEYRRLTDAAYNKQYFFMSLQKSQDVYYLNEPSVGTDAIVDVHKVWRINMLGLANFAPDNIYAQQFLNQFYVPGVQWDLISVHLMHQLSEMHNLLFASDIGFNWREPSRELRIYRRPGTTEKVLIETTCDRMEQDLLVDRWAAQWIQQWAEGELLLMLARIRGKFGSLPGPGGGLQLNAADLLTEGIRLQEDCTRQVRMFEVGQNGSNTFFSPFVLG